MTGTWLAAVLAFCSILGAAVLSYVAVERSLSGDADVLVLRLLLSCIAIFLAMGFGCLGFGLFLIQAQGVFRARTSGASVPVGMVETSAPGLIVFVCATVIVFLALRMEFSTGHRASDGAAKIAMDGLAPAGPTAPLERLPLTTSTRPLIPDGGQ